MRIRSLNWTIASPMRWRRNIRTRRNDRGGRVAEHEEISIIEEIDRMHSADPFVPFEIMMTSGQRYEIGPGDSLIGSSTIWLISHRRGKHLLRQNQISEIS